MAGEELARAAGLALRDGVLILDNCEHVIDAAAELAARVLVALDDGDQDAALAG